MRASARQGSSLTGLRSAEDFGVAKPRRHTSARRLVDWADQHLGRKRLAQRGDAAHVHRLPGRVALSSSVVMKMMGNGEPDSDRPRRRSIPPPRRNPGRTRARRGQINTSSAPPNGHGRAPLSQNHSRRAPENPDEWPPSRRSPTSFLLTCKRACAIFALVAQQPTRFRCLVRRDPRPIAR